MKTYIFGYGSLINKRSCQKTSDVQSSLIPVKLSGYLRHCQMQVPELHMSALGIYEDKDSTVNGVIYEIKPEQLDDFDAREIGYTRVTLSHGKLDFIYESFSLDSTDNIYIYSSEKYIKSEKNLPILQSYVDVCLDGCLDFGEEFTKDFCNYTDFGGKIIDDRNNPLYLRNLGKDHDYSKVDMIYGKYLLTQTGKGKSH